MVSHIPQPPHSTGQPFKGLRAHIEAHQIPSPVEFIDADAEKWEGQTYGTLPGKHPPLSTSDYIAIDQGNSSPKFIRVSTWNLPGSSRLASECSIPLVAVIRPFAELLPGEEDPPVIETGEEGPVRCQKCKAYINPWSLWVAGGMKWKCNLCSHESSVPSEYFSSLDANFMRLDHQERPELNKGTVDFEVPEAYWASNPPPPFDPNSFTKPQETPRQPESINRIFAFDVSRDAVQSGLLYTAAMAVRRILFGEQTDDQVWIQPSINPESRIAIMTYDTSIHFYNLSQERASMIVMADIDDVFIPLKEGLFVDPQGSRESILDLLDSLSTRFEDSTAQAAALGSLTKASILALSGQGGQLIAFQSSSASIGMGALSPLEDETTLYETDKEKTLYAPRQITWRSLAEDCAEEGIGVNLFIGSQKPVDLGTLGELASISGGEIFFHPRFNTSRDFGVLESQLRRLMTRSLAYNCMVRVRCSAGLRIDSYHGNFYRRSPTDLEMGTIDADKTFTVTFDHSRSLDEHQGASIQCAVLYTTPAGRRRVRVLNLNLPVVSLAASVFRFADMDVVVSYLLREAMSKMSTRKMSLIREDLTEKCSAILLGYRRNCAASTAPSQLILPEAFRTLPLYTLGILKSKPLKARNVTSDVRNFYAHKLRACSVRHIMYHLYPRMLAIHDLDDTIALPDPDTGRLSFPTLMRANHLYMSANGVYIIDNEEMAILWIGVSASPQLLVDLLGREDINEIDVHLPELPALDTRLSVQVRNILTRRLNERGLQTKFFIVRQNMDGTEIEFGDLLVEDQNNAAMSYLDYLCLVHKQIHAVLTGAGNLSSSSSMRGTPW